MRKLLSCVLLIGTAYLTPYCNRASCSDQLAEDPLSITSTAQSAAVELAKRSVTVADSIEMTRLGDPSYTGGAPSNGIVAKFSPDGKHFVVILRKGNLEANTNEYSLVLFQTAEVFHSPKPRVLISLASSSNRPAIDNVRWLDDNDTIFFLGEHPGEKTQLYSLSCRSNELIRRTSSDTNLTSFLNTASGKLMIFVARDPVSAFLTENVSRNGIAVTSEDVTDLIRGNYGGEDYNDHTLFIKQSSEDSIARIALHGRIRSDHPEASLSPDGTHLLIQTEATQIPGTWSEYDDQFLKVKMRHPAPRGAHSFVFQYELVDTVTKTSQLLLDAPVASLGSEMAWSSDSKSVVVSDVYLPLDMDNPAERALRKAHSFLVEFKIPSRQFVKVSEDDLRLVEWNVKTGDIVCDIGRVDSLNGKSTQKEYFRKRDETWSRSPSGEQSGMPSLPDIVLDEGMNAPPRIFAIDPPSGRRVLLMDLNPQFQNLALTRVEEITWEDSRGSEVKGGLYWPLNYVRNKKYPLVIQTHGWNPNRFWIDGPWPTAFAAQALACNSFFVAQVPDPDWHVLVTPDEAPRAMALYEGVIDYLDRRGLIDPNRVGITGFSRTYWYATYTLTHSKHHFATAALADGVDYSDFQYLAFSNAQQGLAGEFEQVYGGPPYGSRLSQWLKQSPAFLMDRIAIPLRIQTLGPQSLLLDWHWYSGLLRLRRPVEMIYIPDGTHVLEKPWDRVISQQGNVDWFCFWLEGKEDPDLEKTDQYERWHELRRYTVNNFVSP